MTFILFLALQCFFPIFDAFPGDFLGISLVNRDTQPREYTITATASDGQNPQIGRLTLAGGNQSIFLLKDVVPAVPATGSIRIEPGGTACTAVLTTGNDEVLAGTEGAITTATALNVPYVEVNTGFTELNHTDTSVAVVNAATADASVRAQLYNLDGTLRGTVSFTIRALGTQVFQVSETFRSVLPNNGMGGSTFQGYIRLLSNVGIAAWQRVVTPMSRTMLRARGPEDLRVTAEAYIPHVAFGRDFGSFLNIINPTNVALDLELTAVDEAGRQLGEVIAVRLQPGEARRSSIGEFFRLVITQIFPQPLITGYVRIRESAGRNFEIAGNVEIFESRFGGRATSLLAPISDVGASSWFLPVAATIVPYYTGYVVLNPHSLLTVQTDVVVEAVGVDGTVFERATLSLSPGQRSARFVTTPNRTGYVRVTSNFPVHVFGAIGTLDGRTLEQIPTHR